MNERVMANLLDEKAFREKIRDDLLRDFESLNPWEFTRRREIAKRLDGLATEIEELDRQILRESGQKRLF